MEFLFVHFEEIGFADFGEGDLLAGDAGPDCLGGESEGGGVGGEAVGECERHCGGMYRVGMGWELGVVFSCRSWSVDKLNNLLWSKSQSNEIMQKS